MPFETTTETRQTKTPLDGTVWILRDTESGSQAEIWPANGFNCYRWVVNGREWLYADPDFFNGSHPARTGNPILFPFPNRIRDGRYTWNGQSYQLPINDPSNKNAIHGFVCYRPWRIVDHGTDGQGAWITGEFQATKDGADCESLWPSDYLLRVTYRMGRDTLTVAAMVKNPGDNPLPFGLGYHPYFCVDENSLVQAPASAYWELEETLPTGRRKPVDSMRDLQQSRRYADLAVDDVLTGLTEVDGPLRDLGRVEQSDGARLQLRGSTDYREIVVFCPPHRKAVCIEPYTCVTDAINLSHNGIDTGWKQLQPGEQWEAVFEWQIKAANTT